MPWRQGKERLSGDAAQMRRKGGERAQVRRRQARQGRKPGAVVQAGRARRERSDRSTRSAGLRGTDRQRNARRQMLAGAESEFLLRVGIHCAEPVCVLKVLSSPAG